MEITWHENTCFRLKGKQKTVVINPEKDNLLKKADIVLSSLDKDYPEFENEKKLINWPGEYEMDDIPIVAFPAFTKSKSQESEEGEGDKTIIFYFELDGFQICHLGDLGHVLGSDTVKAIGDVDILMMNVGENSNLGPKKNNEVLESIDPRILISMWREKPGELFKELDLNDVEPTDKFTIKSRSELSEDKRINVVLEPLS